MTARPIVIDTRKGSVYIASTVGSCRMRSVVFAFLVVAILFTVACTSEPTEPTAATPVPTGPTTTEEPTVPPMETHTPTPTPTEPNPVPTSTATPEPTVTPTPTPAPEKETPAGVLSPLSLHDTEDVNSQLSDAELACLKEGSPGLHLGWAFILPGYGEPQERVEIIECLEDETVARIFVSESAEGVATLSLETSTCVRAAFNEIDPRAMMLAKVEGFPENTLNSATTLHFVTMACLNDAEWETTARWLREDSELREVMQCMMEKLGGPGTMAAAMTKGGRGDQEALAEAAEDCAGEMGPVPAETPATPTATPEPASTAEPSGIAPLDPDDSAGMLARLSQEEQDCITDFELLAAFLSKHPDVEYEDVAQQMGCLEDETLLDLYLAILAWYFQDIGGMFRADTESCIRDALDGVNLGDNIREVYTAEDDLVRQAHSEVWVLTVFYCLSEEEATLDSSESGMTDDEYDGMICTVDAFGGLKEFTEAYRNTGAEEFTKELVTNIYGCQDN